MIKKNKLSIFLLAVVAMLTVYYLKNPKEEKPIETKFISYYQEEKDLRDVNRSNIISDLEEIVASSDVIKEKEIAINKLNEINQTSLNEKIVENKIIDLGYSDCLVVALTDECVVNVSVIDNNLELEEFIDLSKVILTYFLDYKLNLTYESV